MITNEVIVCKQRDREGYEFLLTSSAGQEQLHERKNKKKTKQEHVIPKDVTLFCSDWAPFQELTSQTSCSLLHNDGLSPAGQIWRCCCYALNKVKLSLR